MNRRRNQNGRQRNAAVGNIQVQFVSDPSVRVAFAVFLAGFISSPRLIRQIFRQSPEWLQSKATSPDLFFLFRLQCGFFGFALAPSLLFDLAVPKEVLHFLIHALYLLEINPCQACSPHSGAMTIQELLLHFQSLSEDDKKAFLAQALSTPGGEADTPPAPAPETGGTPADAVRCSHCHARPRRHGHAGNGAQRHFCPNCRRTFCASTETALEHTLKPRSAWELLIRCMVERRTVRDAAETCGIRRTTSFLWRRRILDSLQSMMDSVRMDGIVEADETLFRLSCKGNHSKGGFALPRAA